MITKIEVLIKKILIMNVNLKISRRFFLDIDVFFFLKMQNGFFLATSNDKLLCSRIERTVKKLTARVCKGQTITENFFQSYLNY